MKLRKSSAVFAAAMLAAVAAHSQEANPPSLAEQTKQITQKSTINVETISPQIRRIKFTNPPLNFIVPETLSSLNEAVKSLSRDDDVKVVIFTSDVPGYFFNHFDLNEFPNFLRQSSGNSKPMWVDLISNLANAPFISIASIHGRTQGGGDELALAFDLRYASQEKAVFGQPEVGIGLFPGGGSTDHLARLVGRDRAMEILLTSDDYNAADAERYGWITRAVPEQDLDRFVDKIAARLATFDKTALSTTKRRINAAAFPSDVELLNSYGQFAKSVSWPGLQPRVQIFGRIMQEAGPMKVESNLGRYVGEGNKQLQVEQARVK
ncbi:enoyl-CoA hydratase/isomerase family protein [Ralstonia pseudosolanacearum]|uniref:enoyl-CoA hydratase/isomerase family protein n=1 Tax=Ralstonia pseudosolanacearum TaxID=1310165 RepID=UPI0018D1A654|nr:enoyl-CoA hydratase/isomerase family protein [Ralstonia pseudosolanacearum]